MKRLFHLFPLLFMVACAQNGDLEQEASLVDSAEINTVQIIDTLVSQEEPTGLDTLKNSTMVRDFALAFTPGLNIGSESLLPDTPDSVLNAIHVLKTANPAELEKYMTLIFLKHYRSILEHYGTLHEPELTIKPNPLVAEYKELTKKYVEKRQIEFKSYRIGYDYVSGHKYLLSYKPINKEYQEIVQLMILEGDS